jgi:exosortase
MIPPPHFIYANISLRLKLISSAIGLQYIRLMGVTASREGNNIDIGYTQLQVVDSCSGFGYLIPLIALGLLIAYFMRDNWWKKVLLVVKANSVNVFTCAISTED